MFCGWCFRVSPDQQDQHHDWTEPEEADVTQVSVYDCGIIPPNCLYFMVLDLCVIDKTLLLCPSSWSGIHLSDVQFAEHVVTHTLLTWKILFGRNFPK